MGGMKKASEVKKIDVPEGGNQHVGLIPRQLSFHQGMKVCTRSSDGLLYGSTISRVLGRQKCWVELEDGTEVVAMNKDIHRVTEAGNNTGDIACCWCLGKKSSSRNEIVLCDMCGSGYHQKCHLPVIDRNALLPNVQWNCRLCIHSLCARKGGALKKGPEASALMELKKFLPYDLKSLVWDSVHLSNDQQCYCYCGGPGTWFRKMLQCVRCKQWFHEACLQCLDSPLLLGDRHYIFACCRCNSGNEYLHRLQIMWSDISHLALFHITVENIHKYYDFYEDIMPFINANVKIFHSNLLVSSTESERANHIKEVLTDKTRFQNGHEIKKKCTWWALRDRLPPPSTAFVVPEEGPLNDDTLLRAAARNIKTITIASAATGPVLLRFRRPPGKKEEDGKKSAGQQIQQAKKRKASHDPIDVTHLAKKARRLLHQASSAHSRGSSLNGLSVQKKIPENTDGAVLNGCVKKKVAPGADASPSPKTRLDAIIPRLTSYDGFNHPFKTILEKHQEISHRELKKRLDAFCDTESETLTDSQSDAASENASSAATETSNSQMSALETTRPPFTVHHRKRGRKSRTELGYIEAGTTGRSRPGMPRDGGLYRNVLRNVIDKNTLDDMVKRDVTVSQLRSSVNNYFGAASRLANGEGFSVQARRITPEGRVQYLVEWEGGIIE